VRVAERAVADAWTAHQSCKALAGLRLPLAAAFGLRHRMALFLRALGWYLSEEALEPLWRALGGALARAASLPRAQAAHAAFLEAAAARCLLREPALLRTLTKILRLCGLFCAQLTRAIEDHRLSEAELDARAGANRAGARERAQRERGAFSIDAAAAPPPPPQPAAEPATASANASAAAWALRGRAAHRAGAAADAGADAAGGASEHRARRAARLAEQGDALRAVLAQPAWQALIQKSSNMFNGLVNDFIAALRVVAQAPGSPQAALAGLEQRIDFSGFYAAMARGGERPLV
jgi:hypothetical protein